MYVRLNYPKEAKQVNRYGPQRKFSLRVGEINWRSSLGQPFAKILLVQYDVAAGLTLIDWAFNDIAKVAEKF